MAIFLCFQVDSRERELAAANEAASNAGSRASAAELERVRLREALQEAEARGNAASQEAGSLRAQLQVRGSESQNLL
jgi:hypothetical protein